MGDHDVENEDVEGDEDDDKNAKDAVEKDKVEDDDVEEEDRSQDLGPHFLRACAIEMHCDISQEHFFWKFGRKMLHPRMRPECGHTFCARVRS